MTTRTRSRSAGQATPVVTYRSKSDHVRHLLDQGKTIAEVTRLVPGMGYAFAYGIAKRYGKSETAAARRASASVKINREDHTVVIHPASGGSITVNTIDGSVKKSAK